MILTVHTSNGTEYKRVPVETPLAGTGISNISLDVLDVRHLSNMPPEALREWANKMLGRFVATGICLA